MPRPLLWPVLVGVTIPLCSAEAGAAPCAAPAADQTALFAAADALAPGESCEIPVDLDPAELAAAAGGTATQWTDSGAWDPVHRRIHWIGREAGCGSEDRPFVHLQYDEAPSSWTLASTPDLSPCGHGYDHNAVDPSTGTFVHRPYGSTTAWAFDGTSWAELPPFADGDGIPAIGLTWFDELDLGEAASPGALLWAEVDRVAVLPRGAGEWTTTMLPTQIGGYHNFAQHNPVHHVVIFGGGNDAGHVLYAMQPDGSIAQKADAPIELGIHGSSGTYVSVDPVGGEFLVFAIDPTIDLYEWWTYDVVADTWAMFEGAPILTLETFQVPIPEYGVIAFWDEDGPTMTIYRHSPSDPLPPEGDSGGSGAVTAGSEGGVADDTGGDIGSTGASPMSGTDWAGSMSGTAGGETGGSDGAAADAPAASGCGCRSDPAAGGLLLLAPLLLLRRRRR